MKIFGSTIKETIDSFQPRRHLGGDSAKKTERTITIIRLIVSVALIIISIVVREQHILASVGLLGTILGYWIK